MVYEATILNEHLFLVILGQGSILGVFLDIFLILNFKLNFGIFEISFPWAFQ